MVNEVLKIKELLDTRSHLLVDFPSEKHLEWVKSPAKYKVLLGGNRSGKTETASIEVVWSVLGEHPFNPSLKPPQHWRIHVPSYVQLETVVKEKLYKYIPADALYGGSWERGWNEKYHIIRFKNGSKISFSTHKTDLLNMEGTSLNGVWIDEECPYEQYKSLLFRLIDTDGRLFITATPLSGVTWIYDNLVKPFENGDANYFVTYISTYDNKYLSPDVVADLEKRISEEEREIRLYGKIKNISRRVYTLSESNIMDFPFPPTNAEWFVGLDWGFEHSSALVFGCRLYDTLYVVDEWEKKRIPLTGCGIQIENWLAEHAIPLSRCRVIYDSSLNRVDTNGKAEITALRQFRLRLVPSTKAHALSIEAVNESLREGRIVIHPRCKRLIDAMEHFYFRGGRIDDADPHKDICDAFRYMAYFALNRPEETIEEEEEEEGYPSAKEKILEKLAYERYNKMRKKYGGEYTSYYRRW